MLPKENRAIFIFQNSSGTISYCPVRNIEVAFENNCIGREPILKFAGEMGKPLSYEPQPVFNLDENEIIEMLEQL